MRSSFFITVLIIVLVITVIGCAKPKVNVQQLNDQITKHGIYYWLPETVLVVKIPIEKVSYKPSKIVEECKGEFVKLGFSESTLDKLSKKKSSTKIKISPDKIELSTFGVADPKHGYFVDLQGGFFEKKDILITLTEAGLITSANVTVTDQSLDALVKVAEVGASIASKALVLTAASPEFCAKIAEQIESDLAVRGTYIIGGKHTTSKEVTDLIFKQIDGLEKKALNNILGSTTTKKWTAVIQYKPYKNTPTEFVPFLEISDKCSISVPNTFNDALFIPETFLSEHSNCSNSKTTLKLKIALVDTQQVSMVNIFKYKDDIEAGFRYRIPQQAKLFVLKEVDIDQVGKTNKQINGIETNGIGFKQTMLTENLINDISSLNKKITDKKVQLSEILRLLDNRINSIPKGNDILKKYKGSFKGVKNTVSGYKVYFNDIGLAYNKASISQYGAVVALPSNLGWKETKYVLNFFTESGALKSVGSTATPYPAEIIGQAGAPIGTVLEGISTKKVRKRTIERDAKLLKKEILELDDEIEALENPADDSMDDQTDID